MWWKTLWPAPGQRRKDSSQARRSRQRGRRLEIERLEDRTLFAADPLVSLLGLPTQPFIGEPISFTARFDNNHPTDVGYGPFIDLFLPTIGTDGAGAATDDGISFASANYLGAAVTSTVLTFNALGQATHPYARTITGAPVVVAGTPGNQLVVLQLPFGSFTGPQTPADVTVNVSLSNLADLNAPLNIQSRGGFQFGNDPLDNPTTDPSILQAVNASANISPTLLRLTKTYNGPEDETATGPNYQRRYTITVDIANGQTLTTLDVSDFLPNNLAYSSFISASPAGFSILDQPSTPGAQNAPNNDLVVRFPSVTGGLGSSDVTVTFEFFVPLNDANGTPVINAASGDDVISIDDARAQGNWTPIDVRDPPTVAISDVTNNDHTLADKSIAIQKSGSVVVDTGAPGPSPGDTLEFTLNFQVSDYFTFQNVQIADIIGDGHRLDTTFTPTLSVTEHGVTSSGAFSGLSTIDFTRNFTGVNPVLANPPFNITAPGPINGSTSLRFYVSNELIARGLDGKLIGGAIPNAGTGGPPPTAFPPLLFGATTGTIVFRTVIQQNFSDNFPSGDMSVDHGDQLTNNVTVSGDLLSVANVTTPTGLSEDDISSAGVVIQRGALSKTIYAVNGVVGVYTNPQIRPGDTVTYRLRYTLPSSDFENLVLTDFLPLPIFHATIVTPPFDPTVSVTPPPAGSAKYGPLDTLSFVAGSPDPVLTTDATGNSIFFTYGNFDDPGDTNSEIDLLFTVTASADPFADGLFLTNQVHVDEGTTNTSPFSFNAIVQVILTEPVLNIRKGVVATTNAGGTFNPVTVGPVAFTAPGSGGYRGSGTIHSNGLAATPINSNLSNIDAGDLVTFAIVVENTGSGLNGAFDVRIRDTIPAGFVIPGGVGLNLFVSDGTGAAIAFINLGTGLFGAAGGIELVDPGPTNPDPGALDRFNATNGRNILIVTYDLQTTAAVQPGQALTNTATLFNYAGAEGAPDHTTTDRTDPATVTIATPTPVKSLDATSEAHTGVVLGVERVAIGEIVRYRLVTRLPEGAATAFQVVDQLPAGLQYLNDNTTTLAFVASVAGNITSSTLAGAGLDVAGDDTTVAGINPTFLLPAAAISGGPFGSGTDPIFSLGNLSNIDSDANQEFVVLEFNALVLNSVAASNDAGDNRNNTYIIRVSGVQSGPTSNTVQVRIAEPSATLSKTVSPTTGDARDTVTFTVTYSNPAGANATTSFEARIIDTLPAVLTLNVGSVTITPAGGASGVTNSSAGNTVDVSIDTVPVVGGVTITYTAVITGAAAPNQAITNTANLTYTSLPGTNGTTVNPTGSSTPGAPGSDTGERTGSGVGANDLLASDPSTVTIHNVAPTKSIVATSEAHTSGSNLAIGEIVRYRLAIIFPEGTSTNFRILDTLPAGLSLIDTSQVRVSWTADNDVTEAADLPGADNDAVPPTFVLPAGRISIVGQLVTFDLGTLVNNDSDAGAETITLEFNALVNNVAANNAGDTKPNNFDVNINGVNLATSNTVTATIVEPFIPVNASTKTANRTFGDATDTVLYTVTFANSAGPNVSTAFEVRLVDALPALVTLNVASVSVTLGGGSAGIANNSAGNTVDVTIGTVPPGGTVTVTYSATITASATPGQAITNTANITYTSLPGNGTIGNPAGSNTPGASGAANGERNGTSGGVNDYNGSDTHTVTVNSNTLSGFVYRDNNNNGVFEPGLGETGINGVVVTLAGTDHLGNAIPAGTTSTTVGGGAYSFTSLRPSNASGYTVTEAQPAGFLDGIDTVGTFSGTVGAGSSTGTAGNDVLSNIVVAPGSSLTGINFNFGELVPASIAGFVFQDDNNDGLRQAGEPLLPNVSVTLSGTNDQGAIVPVILTTDAVGAYLFGNLRPGTYTLTEVTPVGYLDGKDMAGTAGGTAAPPVADQISAIPLTAGTNATGYTFGELLPATVTGFVWNDSNNNNGIREAGEPGIGSVTIDLTGTDDLGAVTRTVLTSNINGSYLFSNLRPGTYRVRETQPGGFLDGKESNGTPAGNATVNDEFSSIVLAAGVSAGNYDFGELIPSTLSGFVYQDINNDGIKQASEPGIRNVTVTLTGTDDLGNPVNLTTATPNNTTGAYSFTNLRPGTYAIIETHPVVFADGLDTVGTVGGSAAINDRFTGITLNAAVNGVAYNFGELAPFATELNPNQIQEVRCGLIYNRRTNLFYETITLRNLSNAAINGTIQLDITNLTSGVTVSNRTGMSIFNDPFITVSIAALAPGQSVNVPVQFSPPGPTPVTFTYGTRRFSGDY